jgi:hypothetical protein
VNNFHEFMVAGAPPEILYVTHGKCGWMWDTWEELSLAQLVKIVSDHKCEEKPE